MSSRDDLVWIDLDNSPHVPFFRPIVDELKRHGCSVAVTARDAYNVRELLNLHQMESEIIGRHLGRNKAMKVIGTCARSLQLFRHSRLLRPSLAISHGSRAQMLAATLMRVPSVVVADYEHVTHITRPDVLIVPELMPRALTRTLSNNVLTYPGIKEDVYSSTLAPNASILAEIGIAPGDIVVTMRPPATEAHYHCEQSEALFDAAIDLVASTSRARGIVLPRNDRQHRQLAESSASLFASGKLLTPKKVVDGLNLVWHSDLVISGGGTMNREAAALGVPVYSTFRGPLGAVDRYLAAQGRLTLLESPDDVRRRVQLVARERGLPHQTGSRDALHTIVSHLLNLMDRGTRPSGALIESKLT